MTAAATISTRSTATVLADPVETGFPDLILEKEWVKNDRDLGVAFKPGMGQDQSEQRLCEWRCFDDVDTMNNLYANSGLKPKYIIADIVVQPVRLKAPRASTASSR